jgi:hypothetical protein
MSPKQNVNHMMKKLAAANQKIKTLVSSLAKDAAASRLSMHTRKVRVLEEIESIHKEVADIKSRIRDIIKPPPSIG